MAFETREHQSLSQMLTVVAAGYMTFRVKWVVEDEEEGVMGQANGRWRTDKKGAARFYMVLCGQVLSEPIP